jgi:hypothetical protein
VLIAPNLYNVLLWSGVGIAAVAVFVMGAFADIEAQRKGLPTAVIAKKKSRARALLRWLPAPAILVGLGFSAFVWSSTDVVVVTEDADGPYGMRWKWIGGGLPYRMDRSVPRDPTWIVNHTKRTLIVHTVRYGDGARTFLPLGVPSARIPPGKEYATESVDYFGPDNEPPHTITVSQDKLLADNGVAPASYRVWVTWNR